jgi:hypothetical protein
MSEVLRAEGIDDAMPLHGFLPNPVGVRKRAMPSISSGSLNYQLTSIDVVRPPYDILFA